jgi:hydrogenase maturation protease
MNDTKANRKIVMGLGNTLHRDEGLGVHALKQLEAHLGSEDTQVEFLDGGVLGWNLLPWVEECSHLLVLDAIHANKDPGALIELKLHEIPLFSDIRLSDHQVSFQEVLSLAKIRDHLPAQLHVIGVQPADLSIGVDLSPPIMAAIPKVIERAVAILYEWHLLPGYHK